mmetsp:Transcript_44609/g.142961  ORF Transcript_44609/g.142961 Transcript_44609/m.142961 type:complete len:201 (-) Transcript_44609:225-827(-)
MCSSDKSACVRAISQQGPLKPKCVFPNAMPRQQSHQCHPQPPRDAPAQWLLPPHRQRWQQRGGERRGRKAAGERANVRQARPVRPPKSHRRPPTTRGRASPPRRSTPPRARLPRPRPRHLQHRRARPRPPPTSARLTRSAGQAHPDPDLPGLSGQPPLQEHPERRPRMPQLATHARPRSAPGRGAGARDRGRRATSRRGP